MPLLDWNLKSTFDELYNVPHPDGSKTRLGYDRIYFRPLATGLAKKYVDRLELTDGQSVVILGGGYGWTVEAFNEDYPNIKVVNIDNSTYINSTKDVSSVILNETLDSSKSIDAVKMALGSNTIDWIITEDALPCMSDVDILSMLTKLDTISLNVCHKISTLDDNPALVPLSDDDYPGYGIELNPGQPLGVCFGSGLNWKTKTEWAQLLSPFDHRII